ncbi:MAG: extracellular solute-binding protein [Limnochordia bacterium]|nr:extracellular solute-binding protein [Limnochordia bacterium]
MVEGLKLLVQAFEEQTGIRVHYQVRDKYAENIKVSLASGVMPDIILAGRSHLEAFKQLVHPIPKEIVQPEDWVLPALVENMEIRPGSDEYLFFLLGTGQPSLPAFVNVRVFEEYAMDSDNISSELTKLAETARKLTSIDADGRVQRYGFSTPGFISGATWIKNLVRGSGGAWVVDGKATLETAEVFELFEFLVDNAQQRVFNLIHGNNIQDFVDGRIGVLLTVADSGQWIKDLDPTIELRAIMEPYYGVPAYPGADAGWGLAVMEGGNVDAAMEFVRFVSEPDNHVRFIIHIGNVPYRESLAAHPAFQQFMNEVPWIAPIVESIQYSRNPLFYDDALSGILWTVLRDQYVLPLMRRATAGEISSTEFVRELNHGTQVEINRIK